MAELKLKLVISECVPEHRLFGVGKNVVMIMDVDGIEPSPQADGDCGSRQHDICPRCGKQMLTMSVIYYCGFCEYNTTHNLGLV